MPKTTTVPLEEPIVGHGEPVTQVVLRAPTGMELLELGDIEIFSRAPDGSIFSVERDGIVKQYVERCVVEPRDKLAVLAQLSLVDAMRLKKAVLDFFTDAARRASPRSAES